MKRLRPLPPLRDSLCLHWFSPLPPARSGIADYSFQLLPELCARSQVVIWTDQRQWDPALEKLAPVRHFRPDRLSWNDFNSPSGDGIGVPVYHIGNDPMHASIWEASRHFPGFTVLHDTRLQHLFAGLFGDPGGDQARYVSLMRQYYGKNGANRAKLLIAGRASTEEIARDFPLARLAADASVAAIVHSGEGRKTLEAEGFEETFFLPFPYRSAVPEPVRDPYPPFRIVIAGYLGPNRRLDAFLKAVAGMPEKDLLQIEVYGPVWDKSYIQKVIRAGGLERNVKLKGYTPIRELDQCLRGAHLAVNLRFPTMGEASMSELQFWDHALPSLVTPVGWYSSLPPDTVAFVRPQHEDEDIRLHLGQFVRQPERFFASGDRARALLRSLHDPQRYISELLRIVSQVGRLELRKAGTELGTRVGEDLAAWLPRQTLGMAADRIVREIGSLGLTGTIEKL